MMRRHLSSIPTVAGFILTASAFIGGSAIGGGASSAASEEVARVLEEFHAAAAAADEERYFRLFAPEGVFLGTDGSERWTVEEFRAYVHPYFTEGRGWTYTARARHIGMSSDGNVAWFDEVLDNEKYGECRGTGVLRRIDGRWTIVQYSLTIPVPNEIAAEVVRMIRDASAPREESP